MTTLDHEGDAAQSEFLTALDEAAAKSIKVDFWWRDDDVVTVTPQLETLLALARRFGVPLALAVIPKDATQELAERLSREPAVSVLQHGWRHKRHSPSNEKKMELGDHRPLEEITSELRLGYERFAELFPEHFLPVLVPPWNRIGAGVSAARHEIGLVGLSSFGPRSGADPHVINTHIDIFDWQGARGPLPRARAYAMLSRELQRRLAGSTEPIGLLTHHLIHNGESWAFLEELLATIARHRAVSWPAIPALFNLPQRPR
jgi:hypothetical protein